MPLSTSLRAACALVLLVAACDRALPPPRAQAPASAGAAGPAGAVVPLPATVTSLMGALDTTVTLGAWLASHPSAVVGDSQPVSSEHVGACRIASDSIVVLGRPFARAAIFEFPDPPVGERMPSAPELERSCLLHALWLSTPGGDAPHARALTDTLRRAIIAAAGVGRGTPPGAQRSEWDDVESWLAPGSNLVLGIPATPPGGPARPPDVVIASISIAWRSDRPTPLDDVLAADREARLAIEDSLLAIAGDATLAATLRPVLDEVRRVGDAHPPHSPASDTLLLRAARMVSSTTDSMPVSRRAARLAAVDFAVASSMPLLLSPSRATDSLLASFATYGITFRPVEISGGYEPRRDWLWRAVRLDSLGSTGGGTLTLLLSTGWNAGPGCSVNAGPAPMIAHGEPAVARGVKGALIDYYLGLAWADAAALGDLRAHGAETHEDPVAGVSAAQARTRAIAHLRAALDGLTDRRHRREAWRTLARVMIGRPVVAHFDCSDD